MNVSTSLSQIFNLIQSSHSEFIVHHNLLYTITPILQVFCQLSSILIAYPNLGFNSSYLTVLVPMSDSFIPFSCHTYLCKFLSWPFLTNCIILVMCLVWLMSLPILAIHTYDFISNTMRSACCGTTSGSLFRNSLFIILKCGRSIPTYSVCYIVITFRTWLRNCYWNMCAIINFSILIEQHICSCNTSSIWIVLTDVIIEHHQLVLSINASISQDVR